METILEKIQLIKTHEPKIEITDVVFTEKDDERLKTLENLNFINTPEYIDLKKRADLSNENWKTERLNNDIKLLEEHGFKVINNSFLYEFRKKYNLEKEVSKRYIFDIPIKNLNNIDKKLDTFISIRKQIKDLVCISHRKSSKQEICNKCLYILAPEEHFDKSIPLVDPDPIALLQLEKGYYLYLDAWDIEKIMFDNDTNNPELLN